MFDKNINTIVENVGHENDELFFDRMEKFEESDFENHEFYEEDKEDF